MLEELENKNFENVPYSECLLEAYELSSLKQYYNKVCQVLETATPVIENTSKSLKALSATVQSHNREREEKAKIVQQNMAQIEEHEEGIRAANQHVTDYKQLTKQATSTRSKIADACKELDQLNQQVLSVIL